MLGIDMEPDPAKPRITIMFMHEMIKDKGLE